jgi:hypothetical protein
MKSALEEIWSRASILLENPPVDSENEYYEGFYKDIGEIFEMAAKGLGRINNKNN